MTYFPVKVTKTQQYTMYVEAESPDEALETAAARLRRAKSLVDQDSTDDYSIHASVSEDDGHPTVETVEDAMAANVTYVVDRDGMDVEE